MLQLRCLPVVEEDYDTDDQGFRLELAVDPARLLFTLNVCRLMLPPNTAPLHLENWRHIEALMRQLATIYQQACLYHSTPDQHHPGRRTRAQRRPPEDCNGAM